MKNPALKVLLMAAVLIPVSVYAQPRPGNPTTATVITKAEIDKISATEQSQRVRDENAKVVDIGDGWSMELGIIHRASTRNPPPAPAAGAGKAAAQTVPCGEQMDVLQKRFCQRPNRSPISSSLIIQLFNPRVSRMN
jgi:hypothetical protein